jgi:hypothetical protein
MPQSYQGEDTKLIKLAARPTHNAAHASLETDV